MRARKGFMPLVDGNWGRPVTGPDRKPDLEFYNSSLLQERVKRVSGETSEITMNALDIHVEQIIGKVWMNASVCARINKLIVY